MKTWCFFPEGGQNAETLYRSPPGSGRRRNALVPDFVVPSGCGAPGAGRGMALAWPRGSEAVARDLGATRL